MSGRVLTSSAIVDIATDRSVYGRAFLVAAVEDLDASVAGRAGVPATAHPAPHNSH